MAVERYGLPTGYPWNEPGFLEGQEDGARWVRYEGPTENTDHVVLRPGEHYEMWPGGAVFSEHGTLIGRFETVKPRERSDDSEITSEPIQEELVFLDVSTWKEAALKLYRERPAVRDMMAKHYADAVMAHLGAKSLEDALQRIADLTAAGETPTATEINNVATGALRQHDASRNVSNPDDYALPEDREAA